jgi:hypothetical protein
MMQLSSILLLVCSLLGDPAVAVQPAPSDLTSGETDDTAAAAAVPLPPPQPETNITDTSPGLDTAGEGQFARPEMTGATTAVTAKTPQAFIPYLDLGAGRLNFESTESDVIDMIVEDEDDWEEEENKLFSVTLGENNRPSGIGLLVPGGIITTVGILLTAWVLGTIDDASSEASPEDVIASSMVTVTGAVLLTVGIRQMRVHIRWSDRYRLSQPR